MDNVKILLVCGVPSQGPFRYVCRSPGRYGGRSARGRRRGGAGGVVRSEDRPLYHCNKCLRDDSDRCTVFHDDMDELYDKFFQADGIVIGCPVYEMNVTAQLAQFYSRFRSSWKLSVDDPDFFQYKVGAALTVGGTLQRRSGERHPLHHQHLCHPRHQ